MRHYLIAIVLIFAFLGPGVDAGDWISNLAGPVEVLTDTDFLAWELELDTSPTGSETVTYSCVSSDDNVVAVMGDGVFTVTNPLGSGSEFRAKSMASGDLDNDGDIDVVFGDSSGNIVFLINDGSGSFTEGDTYVSSGSEVNSLQIVDLNGDGWNDILACIITAGTLWYENDQAGGFSSTVIDADSQSFRMEVADIDLDGDFDILLPLGSTGFRIYTNDGAGDFSVLLTRGINCAYAATAADLDTDGLPEVIVSCDGTGTDSGVYILWPSLDVNGDVQFIEADTSFNSNSFYYETKSVVAGDFDGDNKVDIMSGTDTSDAYFFKNTDNNGGFSEEGEQTEGNGFPEYLATADFNLDGHLDLIFANQKSGDEGHEIWLNDGSGSFSEDSRLTNVVALALTINDFDGDGDLDIAMGTAQISFLSKIHFAENVPAVRSYDNSNYNVAQPILLHTKAAGSASVTCTITSGTTATYSGSESISLTIDSVIPIQITVAPQTYSISATATVTVSGLAGVSDPNDFLGVIQSGTCGSSAILSSGSIDTGGFVTIDMSGVTGELNVCICDATVAATGTCDISTQADWASPTGGDTTIGQEILMTVESQIFATTSGQSLLTSGVSHLEASDRLGLVSITSTCGTGLMDFSDTAVDGALNIDMTSLSGHFLVCVCDATVAATPGTCSDSTPLDWFAPSSGLAEYGQELTITVSAQPYTTGFQSITIDSIDGLSSPNDYLGLVDATSGCGGAIIVSSNDLPSLGNTVFLDTTGLSGVLSVCVCDATLAQSGFCNTSTPSDWSDPSSGAYLLFEQLVVSVPQPQSHTHSSGDLIQVTDLAGVVNPNDKLGVSTAACGSGSMLVIESLPASDGAVSLDMSSITGTVHVCVCSAASSSSGTCISTTTADWSDPSGGAATLFQTVTATIASTQAYISAGSQTIAVTDIDGVDNPNDLLGVISSAIGCGVGPMVSTTSLPSTDGSVVIDMTPATGTMSICICDATIAAGGSCSAATSGDWVDPTNGSVQIGQVVEVTVSDQSYMDAPDQIIVLDSSSGVEEGVDAVGVVSQTQTCGTDVIQTSGSLTLNVDTTLDLSSFSGALRLCVCDAGSASVYGTCDPAAPSDWTSTNSMLTQGFPDAFVAAPASGSDIHTNVDIIISVTGGDQLDNRPFKDNVYVVNTADSASCDPTFATVQDSDLGPSDASSVTSTTAALLIPQSGTYIVCYNSFYRSSTLASTVNADGRQLPSTILVEAYPAEAATLDSVAVGVDSAWIRWTPGQSYDCVWSSWSVLLDDNSAIAGCNAGDFDNRTVSECFATGLSSGTTFNFVIVETCSDTTANSGSLTFSFETGSYPDSYTLPTTYARSPAVVSLNNGLHLSSSDYAYVVSSSENCNSGTILDQDIDVATFESATFTLNSPGFYLVCYYFAAADIPNGFLSQTDRVAQVGSSFEILPVAAQQSSILTGSSTVSSTSVDLVWNPSLVTNDCHFSSWSALAYESSVLVSGLGGCTGMNYRAITSCTLTGLSPSTEYAFEIKEICSDARADAISDSVILVTLALATVASVPTSVSLSNPSTTTCDLAFAPGTANDCVFSGWDVQVVNSNGVEIALHSSAPCSSTSMDTRSTTTCIVSYLEPGSTYSVSVRELCTNIAAQSLFSTSSSCTTTAFSDSGLNLAQSLSSNLTASTGTTAQFETAVETSLAALTNSESTVAISSGGDDELLSYAENTRSEIRTHILDVVKDFAATSSTAEDIQAVASLVSQIVNKPTEISTASRVLALSILQSQLSLVETDPSVGASLNISTILNIADSLFSQSLNEVTSLPNDASELSVSAAQVSANQGTLETNSFLESGVKALLKSIAGDSLTTQGTVSLASGLGTHVQGYQAAPDTLINNAVPYTFAVEGDDFPSGLSFTFPSTLLNDLDPASPLQFVGLYRDETYTYQGDVYDTDNPEVDDSTTLSSIFSLTLYQNGEEVASHTTVDDPIVISWPNSPLPADHTDGRSWVRQCRFWNHDLQSWLTVGCSVDETTTTASITVCHCTHLTEFQLGAVLPTPTSLTTSDVAATFDLDNLSANASNVAVIALLMFFFVMTYFWAYRVDWKIDRLNQNYQWVGIDRIQSSRISRISRISRSRSKSFNKEDLQAMDLDDEDADLPKPTCWMRYKVKLLHSHSWLSIVYRNPASDFNSRDRVICLGTSIFTAILATAILTSDRSSWTIVGTVLISVALAYLNKFIFKHTFFKIEGRDHSLVIDTHLPPEESPASSQQPSPVEEDRMVSGKDSEWNSPPLSPATPYLIQSPVSPGAHQLSALARLASPTPHDTPGSITDASAPRDRSASADQSNPRYSELRASELDRAKSVRVGRPRGRSRSRQRSKSRNSRDSSLSRIVWQNQNVVEEKFECSDVEEGKVRTISRSRSRSRSPSPVYWEDEEYHMCVDDEGIKHKTCLPARARKWVHLIGWIWMFVAALLILTYIIKYENSENEEELFSQSNEFLITSLCSIFQQLFVNEQLSVLIGVLARLCGPAVPMCLLSCLEGL